MLRAIRGAKGAKMAPFFGATDTKGKVAWDMADLRCARPWSRTGQGMCRSNAEKETKKGPRTAETGRKG